MVSKKGNPRYKAVIIIDKNGSRRKVYRLKKQIGGKTCKSNIIKDSGKRYKSCIKAKRIAKLAWKKAAKSAYGKKYDTFYRAKNKSKYCYGPTKKYVGVAKGKPCKK